jgi:hypothetical protein
MTHIKAYMKRILDKLKAEKPERVEHFQKGAQALVKKILDNFNDYDFYTGEKVLEHSFRSC